MFIIYIAFIVFCFYLYYRETNSKNCCLSDGNTQPNSIEDISRIEREVEQLVEQLIEEERRIETSHTDVHNPGPSSTTNNCGEHTNDSTGNSIYPKFSELPDGSRIGSVMHHMSEQPSAPTLSDSDEISAQGVGQILCVGSIKIVCRGAEFIRMYGKLQTDFIRSKDLLLNLKDGIDNDLQKQITIVESMVQEVSSKPEREPIKSGLLLMKTCLEEHVLSFKQFIKLVQDNIFCEFHDLGEYIIFGTEFNKKGAIDCIHADMLQEIEYCKNSKSKLSFLEVIEDTCQDDFCELSPLEQKSIIEKFKIYIKGYGDIGTKLRLWVESARTSYELVDNLMFYTCNEFKVQHVELLERSVLKDFVQISNDMIKRGKKVIVVENKKEQSSPNRTNDTVLNASSDIFSLSDVATQCTGSNVKEDTVLSRSIAKSDEDSSVDSPVSNTSSDMLLLDSFVFVERDSESDIQGGNTSSKKIVTSDEVGHHILIDLMMIYYHVNLLYLLYRVQKVKTEIHRLKKLLHLMRLVSIFWIDLMMIYYHVNLL